MRIAILAVIVFGLSSLTAQEKKSDFVVSAIDYSKEYESDRKAFTAKYQNKVVELTGVVFSTRPWESDVMLEGNKTKGRIAHYVTCKPVPKLQEQLRGLARGQEVTFRGKAGSAVGLYLADCEIAKLEASPAIPVTVASLEAEFKKDAKAAEKKYEGKSVVVRVRCVRQKLILLQLVLYHHFATLSTGQSLAGILS